LEHNWVILELQTSRSSIDICTSINWDIKDGKDYKLQIKSG